MTSLLFAIVVLLASQTHGQVEDTENSPRDHQTCTLQGDNTWCSGDLDPDLTCWVTSRDVCDGKVRIGAKSICKHTKTGDVTKCLEGEWKLHSTNQAVQQPLRRVKRGWWLWGRRSRSSPPPDYPPTIRCPGDVSRTPSAGHITSSVTWSNPTTSDDRGVRSVVQVAGPVSGSEFSAGTTVVRYKVTDTAGQTAQCFFSVTVTVSYCSQPTSFPNGQRNCSGAMDNVYGSVCTHSCSTGYTLSGNSLAECMSNQMWSASFPSCQRISCGTPGSVAGAQMQCPSGHLYSDTCQIVCQPGYSNTGPRSISCGSSGTWNTAMPCRDVTAPVFTHGCPNDKILFSGPLRAPVTLTFDYPTTSDNSNSTGVTLTSSPTKGTRLAPGSHVVTITATDVTSNTARCTFTVVVQVHECPPVMPQTNGQWTCTDGHVEGSKCTLSCNQGYRVQGQPTLTCLSSETWDNGAASCVAVICATPPQVPQGQFSCPNGRQSPSTCTLTCVQGFKVAGSGQIQCQQNGTWTSPGLCQDEAAPVFPNGCPANITIYAERLGRATRVTWTAPSVTDNSGDVIRPTSDVIPGSAFTVGVTVVTYTATDVSGNSRTCHFNVTVTALSCGAPGLTLTETGHSALIGQCPDGHVHGAVCTLSCPQGTRLQGRHSVTCERDDGTHPPSMTWSWGGNDAVKPICFEDQCPPLRTPQHGAFSCYHGDRGWDCYMSCESAWEVPLATDGRFVCSNDDRVWQPHTVPDCVERFRPNSVRMLADQLYFADSCNVSTDTLRNNFISYISTTLYSSCRLTVRCVAENIEVFCGDTNSTRNRRDADEALHALWRTRRQSPHVTSHYIRVTFDVNMPYVEDASSEQDTFKKYNESAVELQDALYKKKVVVPNLDLVPANEGSRSPVAWGVDCPPGTVSRSTGRFSCVPSEM